jgi:hypothetical protein
MKMPKKRTNKKHEGRLPGDETTDAPPPKRRTGITVGNISDISGNVNIAGRDIVSTNMYVPPEKESNKLAPRLLGDSSTDAPPPDVSKKKRPRGK